MRLSVGSGVLHSHVSHHGISDRCNHSIKQAQCDCMCKLWMSGQSVGCQAVLPASTGSSRSADARQVRNTAVQNFSRMV
jgi:hypothetical protein